MAITVAGTFSDRGEAEEAVERLRAAHVPVSDISMVVRDPGTAPPVNIDSGVHGTAVVGETVTAVPPVDRPGVGTRAADDEMVPVGGERHSATAAGLTAGSVIGGIGGLLLGLATMAVPGIGPVLAAGPIAAALGGAAVGAAAAGLVGALIDAGLPEEYAATYASELEAGSVLLTVKTDEGTLPQVRQIMHDAGAVNIMPSQ